MKKTLGQMNKDTAHPFARFQSLTKSLFAVPKTEADKQKALAAKKQSRPKQSSTARG